MQPNAQNASILWRIQAIFCFPYCHVFKSHNRCSCLFFNKNDYVTGWLLD